jgi:hypothetical protein
MPLSQGNIGHCDVAFFNAISNLNRFEEGTENPRVGGSIPPLATIQINIPNQEVASERMDSLSNISAGVQYYGPLLA